MGDPHAQDTLDAFFRRDVIGGIVPGTIILAEIWLLVIGLQGRDLDRSVTQLWTSITQANLAGGILLVTMIGGVGWLLGWVSRKAGFVMMRQPGIAEASRVLGDLPRSTKEVLAQLQREDQVLYRSTSKAHYWWPAAPSYYDDSRMSLFHRAKQWLVRNDPGNAVAEKEAVINALCGLAVAVFGLLVLLFWLPIWFAVVPVVGGVVLLILAARERRYEEVDVLRNLMNATTYRVGGSSADETQGRVSWAVFERLFRDGVIRAELDWKQVSGLPVWLEVEEGVPAEWFTVWYSRGDGDRTVARHCDEGARPMTVGEAASLAESPAGLPQSERLGELAQGFAAVGKADLLLAGWRTPNGQTLILDGNHRAVAATLSGVPTRLACFVVYGPASGRLLPDLNHFA